MSLDLSSILFGLISLGAFILLIRVLRMRKEKVHGFFSFLFFVLFFLVISIFRLALSLNAPISLIRAETQARFPLYAAVIISFLLLQETIAFLNLKPMDWFWWIAAALGFVGAVAANENINGMFLDRIPLGSAIILRSSAGLIGLFATWMAFSLGAVLITWFTRQRIVHPLHRNRSIFWLGGLLIGIAGLSLSTGSTSRYPIGEVVILLAAMVLGYTLFTHDLPDIKGKVRQSFSMAASGLLSILVYCAFFFFIQPLLNPEYGLGGFAGVVILAVVLTLLINPVVQWLQKFLAQRLVENDADANQLVRDYSKKISNIIDLGHLADVITSTIEEGMKIRRVHLFLVRQGEDYFDLMEVMASGIEHTALKVHFSQNNPVAEYLRYEHRPLAQYDIDLLTRFRNTPADEMNGLKSLAIDLYVPVSIQNRWIGLLGLGTKKSRSRYFQQELAVVESLAEQTAVSLENARLYADVILRSEENERLNRELTAANEDLSRLDKAKSDFINIASHELRTPLTQIIGYNDIMCDMASNEGIPASTGQSMMDGVGKAARRLEEIVNTMFDVSKLEVGGLEMDKSPVSILSVINAAVDKWKDALVTRQETLTLSPSLDKLPITYGDGKRLVQVFSQLIQNAIQSTPDGGQIRISGQRIKENRGKDEFIEIVVADTGIGIAPDELERIFEKFYRSGDVMLHSSGEIKFKGAGPGLGLTICRGIVEAHGGKVWAESTSRDEKTLPGSKFHVLLPILSEN